MKVTLLKKINQSETKEAEDSFRLWLRQQARQAALEVVGEEVQMRCGP